MPTVITGTDGINQVQAGAVESGDLPAEAYQKNNILGTVSESAGVPTGAVIERGSNANGEFVRYADGTMICFRNDSRSGMVPSTRDGSWTLPSSFSTVTCISHTSAFGNFTTSGEPWNGDAYARTLFSVGSTINTYEYVWKWDGPGNANSVRISLIAVGRWY
jgi:hypothetical protein